MLDKDYFKEARKQRKHEFKTSNIPKGFYHQDAGANDKGFLWLKPAKPLTKRELKQYKKY